MQSSASKPCSSTSCRGCYGEIAEIVANTQGLYWQQTKGKGDAHTLNVIWRAVGEMAEDLLARKKSVILPDCFHASVKVQSVEYYGRIAQYHKPQIVLLPDFTSKFHLKNVLVMADAHYHATVPCYISYTTLGAILGIDKYIVEAAIKDSIREIGKYLQRNPKATLTIDIGIGFLEFHEREYRMKWSKQFLDALTATVGANSIVTPYDPPSMTKGGPTADCRFQAGCITQGTLQQSVAETVDAESRLTVAEMNDGFGGSAYRKTYW